jgi:hypothetical protein
MPDAAQRATEDADKFAMSAASTAASLAKPLLEVVILSRALAGLMGPGQLLKCYAYFIFSGYWIRKVTVASQLTHA